MRILGFATDANFLWNVEIKTYHFAFVQTQVNARITKSLTMLTVPRVCTEEIYLNVIATTSTSLGTALWMLQEPECLLHQCRYITAEPTHQAGLMANILARTKERSPGRSAFTGATEFAIGKLMSRSVTAEHTLCITCQKHLAARSATVETKDIVSCKWPYCSLINYCTWCHMFLNIISPIFTTFTWFTMY